MSRALRVLLVANDGFSAGHVARAIAIAHGLARVAELRGLALRTVLATTSEADALLAGAPAAIVRLPAPVAARAGGLGDVERRALVRGALDGVVAGLAPDLLVVDTFPSGPHGELAGLRGPPAMKRALVRRATAVMGEPPAALRDALTAGLDAYDLALLAGDPGPIDATLPVPVRQVPPITLAGGPRADRAASRARLGLEPDGRMILIASGGGGDPAAEARATAIAEAVVRVAPDAIAVIARGPLDRGARQVHGSSRSDAQHAGSALTHGLLDEAREVLVHASIDGIAQARRDRIRVLRFAPLAYVMTAFDGAFAAAGYNTAHELAACGVPAALFAQPRPFDDQAARAARFAAAGLAHALTRFDDDAIAAALAWMQAATPPALETSGAAVAAAALIELVTGKAEGAQWS